MSMNIIEVADQNFEQEILNSDTPVLVDFWAPWCGPCLAIAPALEELAGEYAGKMKIAKLNVDDNQETAGKYQIMSIPNMKIFKGGQVVDEIVGAYPKQTIAEKIDANL